jgi:hypothetical protein
VVLSKKRSNSGAMRILKILLLILMIVFIAIQFVRPSRNISGLVSPADITKTVTVPDSVLDIFRSACYDCHSNNSRYPWYVNIQPIGWMMANHIKNGKANLNFSEFGAYSKRKKINKLRTIETSLKDGSMPLSSYRFMHKDAILSPENKILIREWAVKARDSLVINY